MVDDQLGVAVAFNGCIYNYRELRTELQAAGYTFQSTSDTEVVLAAYHCWGERFPEHLVGMFAVVVADQERRRLLLVRDRLGVKPLYLAETPRRLRFASTLPALLCAGEVDTELDTVALHHYLSWHSIVPGPRTILRGVRKLPPATVRVIESDGRSRDHVYWRPDYTRALACSDMNPCDWQEALTAALSTAIERRLVADVPVGVLLSGGLDSSLIVALLARTGQRPLQTFSIGFEGAAGERGDEFAWSSLVASTFDTDHHRIRVANTQLAPAVEQATRVMTEPMGSPDVVGFYLLSEQVSRNVKVALAGQGADEVFAGYGYYQPLAHAPRAIATDLFTEAFFDRSHADLGQVVQPEYLCDHDASRELVDAHLLAPGADTALDAALRLDTHVLLPDDPLKRVDSMSMAWGLEVRVPFLDHDLVDLAATCPPKLKAAQGGKGVLKDLARALLPAELIDRPKGHFPVPAVRHPQGPLLELVSEALYSPAAKSRGLFRPQYIEELFLRPSDHRTPAGYNKLWHLGMLEMWLQVHGVG